MAWYKTSGINKKKYTCGHCKNNVGPNSGYFYESTDIVYKRNRIYICPVCDKPTYFSSEGNQFPGVSFGETVQHLPNQIEEIYNEARRCLSVSCYTSAVMVCRKLLMHIAVEKGAKENKKFMEYVEWLKQNNYLPPDGESWVDYIRQKGNEANHEIILMEQKDAESLITFLGIFLKFVYEFPASLPNHNSSSD